MKSDTGIDSVLSRDTRGLELRIRELRQKYAQLWWDTEACLPSFFKTFTPGEQKEIKKELSLFVDKMLAYREQYQVVPEGQDLDFKEPISRTQRYMTRLFNRCGIDLEDTFARGIVHSTHTFIERVKAFDTAMDPQHIYQALRNIWIMNTLQVYLGQEMGCSDSMFAYSMLYPYTDNIMDDASISFKQKLRLSRNLKNRLEGKPYTQPMGIEKKLAALVLLVEEQFPRHRFPTLFQSLLGIYNAQIKSLVQQRQNLDMPPQVIDILGISFEKGGTSVLADGYLIKGELDELQQDFCFGLGTFLQLADDIQDILVDQGNGHMTLFSQAAGRYKLDLLANKLFHFIPQLMISRTRDGNLRALNDLFQKSFQLHIMEAVGKNRKLYSKPYIEELQVHFPVPFSFLKKLRKKLEKLHSKQKEGTFNLNVVSAGLLALTSRVWE